MLYSLFDMRSAKEVGFSTFQARSLYSVNVGNESKGVRVRTHQNACTEITDNNRQTDPVANPGHSGCDQHYQPKILNEINSAHQLLIEETFSLMLSTGHGAWRKTPSVMLPTRNRLDHDWLCVGRTIKSASDRMAWERIV